jgi:hypothetical protein
MNRAYFLGSTGIEPIHLLLGEMDSQYTLSISAYLFKDKDYLHQIVENNRLGEPIVIPHPDKLKEDDSAFVEKIIRKSLRISNQLGGGLVEPYHLFLALEKINPYFFKEVSKENDFSLKKFYFKNYGLNLTATKTNKIKKMLKFVFTRSS